MFNLFPPYNEIIHTLLKKIRNDMWPSKRFCLALIGLILYLLDVGSDNWVGYILIQSCHFRYGAAVFCLVWVLPGSFQFLWGIKYKDNCTNWGEFFGGLFLLAMNIPVTICLLIEDLIKLDDETLLNVKS